MKHLRSMVRRQDIYWWVNSYLEAAFAKDLNSFPIVNVEDYLPQFDLAENSEDA
jgi:hypothetical protein